MPGQFWNDFYDGKINPLERFAPLGKEAQIAKYKAYKGWEKFSALLSHEQKEAYNEYEALQNQYNSFCTTERFISGFSLGMMFVCEAIAHSQMYLMDRE